MLRDGEPVRWGKGQQGLIPRMPARRGPMRLTRRPGCRSFGFMGGVRTRIGWAGAGLICGLALFGADARAQGDPPEASQLWSISSDDCISVNADGEPWTECGFQSFDMNADGTRVLAATNSGAVLLWDGEGRELARISWPDEEGGASGFPSARVVIAGRVGVAVVHANQLLLIDLADGHEIARRTLDLMTVQELRPVGNARVFADTRDREWGMSAYEIDLTTGALRATGDNGLERVGPSYWITGSSGNDIVLHRDGAPDLPLERPCMPTGARYCTWVDRPGRSIHALDVSTGRWSRLDFGRPLDEFTGTEFVASGDWLAGIACWLIDRGYPGRYDCSIRDFANGREIGRMSANTWLRAVGGVDEHGGAEIRIWRSAGEGRWEQVRMGLDGSERMIDPQGRARVSTPQGGMILPDQDNRGSLLVDVAGRPVARLPFRAQICGNGWPAWQRGCPVSADGRRWLVPVWSSTRSSDGDVNRTGLAVFSIPDWPH